MVISFIFILNDFNKKRVFKKAENCVTEKNKKQENVYSAELEFLVVGHAYGNKENSKIFI